MVSTQPVIKIALPKEITMDVLRRDTLCYCAINLLAQKYVAYDIGSYPADLSNFLAGRRGLPVNRVLSLINLLYL